MISAGQLSGLYKKACNLELEAFKPGNVSVYADGHDMCVADFRTSALVSADPICNPELSLGEKIFYAVEATRNAVGCNTNLGIILLCAPMIHAALDESEGVSFRQKLRKVLFSTTIKDADWVFKAISLAKPGGLGASEDQDVSGPATVTLLEAMAIASTRDRIALQYCTDYKDIFDFGVLRYNYRLAQWGSEKWAAASVFSGMLQLFPDSHIERKHGNRYSSFVGEKIALINEELDKSVDPELIIHLFYSIDKEFKSNGINPGTTADLTVATVLAVFIQDLVIRN